MSDAKTPEQLLEELRAQNPEVAAKLDTQNAKKLHDNDKIFEQYMSMCANASSILGVIAYHEAKHPREQEDARKSAVVATALVSSVHELIASMPPAMRVNATQTFLEAMSMFIEKNEAKLVGEIQKAHKQRDAMLARLAEAQEENPVEGLS